MGFIPGITADLSQLGFAGHRSEAMLLGIFQVSVLHNIVHLLFGIAGIVLARTVSRSRNYLVWGGAVYLLLWAYGVVIGQDTAANVVPLNTADNWLHLVLGIGMLGLGLGLAEGTLRRRTPLNRWPSRDGDRTPVGHGHRVFFADKRHDPGFP